MDKKQEDPFPTWEEIQNWSSLLFKRSKQIDDIVKALHSVNIAAMDKKMLKELISSIALLNQKQSTPPKKKAASRQTAKKDIHSDELLVQLMNTPAIGEVFKEVFKNKRKW